MHTQTKIIAIGVDTSGKLYKTEHETEQKDSEMNTSQECDQCAKDHRHEFGPTDFLERNQEAAPNSEAGRIEVRDSAKCIVEEECKWS